MANGKKLAKELRNRGLIFKFVAEKTGISYDSLKHYLIDSRPIPEKKLRLIVNTFGIDAKIFGLNDTKNCQTNVKRRA